MTISLYGREENTVHKGVNAGFQRFQSYSTELAEPQSNTISGIVGYPQ